MNLEVRQVRCPKCGAKLESKVKLCPNCNSLISIDTHDVSVASRYSDVLKPRFKVSVKGLGSRMSGSSRVAATSHRIDDSYGSESSRKVRCFHCGSVNDKSDKSCRNCGAKITS